MAVNRKHRATRSRVRADRPDHRVLTPAQRRAIIATAKAART